MKKTRLVLLALVAALAAVIFAPMALHASEELGQSVVFVQVPDDWETPRIWAWGPRGDASPIGWPGNLYLMEVPDNPGWYYIWIPNDKEGGLINAEYDGDGIQTDGFDLPNYPIWVTINGPGDDFTVTDEPQTTGAIPPATVAIFAYLPDGWTAPRVWAWGPQGNVSPTDWPGNLYMRNVPDNPGWFFYYVPANTAGALVNATYDGDTIQTDGFDLDFQNTWVTIDGPDDDFTATHDPQTTGAVPQMYTVIFAQFPDDWETPRLWAWGPRGDASPTGWPGSLYFTPDPHNPGWHYLYVPVDKAGGLFNADYDGDTIQTNGFDLPYGPIWVTVTGTEYDFEVTTTPQTSGPMPPFVPVAVEEGEPLPPPDLPDVDMVVLRAYVPEGWTDVGVWAWNTGDGLGNVFASWPGEQFTERDGDWYIMYLPGWVDHVIINADFGGVQTESIGVEPGQDIWVVVSGPGDDWEVSHEPVDAYIPEPTPRPLRTPAPERVLLPAEDDTSNTTLIAIIAGVAVAVVAAAGAGFVMLRKKKDDKK